MNLSRLFYTFVLLLTFCFSFTTSGNAQVTNTFCSTDVPLVLLAGESGESVLDVPDVGEILNVVVKLQVDMRFREDLDATLSSPNPTFIELIENRGGDGDDFGTTCQPMPNFILDDEASQPVSDFTTNDPAAGTYRPDDPLSNLIGEDASGQWTLFISDDGGGFGATLNCWCVEITTDRDVVRNIPTISQWGMIALTVVLGASAVLYLKLRRRKQAV